MVSGHVETGSQRIVPKASHAAFNSISKQLWFLNKVGKKQRLFENK